MYENYKEKLDWGWSVFADRCEENGTRPTPEAERMFKALFLKSARALLGKSEVFLQQRPVFHEALRRQADIACAITAAGSPELGPEVIKKTVEVFSWIRPFSPLCGGAAQSIADCEAVAREAV